MPTSFKQMGHLKTAPSRKAFHRDSPSTQPHAAALAENTSHASRCTGELPPPPQTAGGGAAGPSLPMVCPTCGGLHHKHECSFPAAAVAELRAMNDKVTCNTCDT